MSDERTLDLLEAKIRELQELNKMEGMDLSSEITKLETKLESLRAALYADLSDWDRVKIARHSKRPYACDYFERIFTDFYELHGDRFVGDDRALIIGLARLDGKPVAVIGQQKGRTTEENKERFFGMPRPQGYRKAHRLLLLAERFDLPVISLVDTAGAYPGLESESGNIGGAIAENLALMSRLRVPIVVCIVGEGGSGGALAVGVGDRILMLENATFSVISPEGAAAILWKDKDRTREAAEALQLTAGKLLRLGLIDEVVPEPLGGAHKNWPEVFESVRTSLVRHVEELQNTPRERLVEARYARYRNTGEFHTLAEA
ncbi:acetyl-CoA carboxylase carboxyltransferase subunit alpha [Candidatus Bipolaricaulota bacterium]|nr:acetyl-CoA carboxylase carboxyltransferase subunit alpha [Candidatus Bipolaricaulota bacterium]